MPEFEMTTPLSNVAHYGFTCTSSLQTTVKVKIDDVFGHQFKSVENYNLNTVVFTFVIVYLNN